MPCRCYQSGRRTRTLTTLGDGTVVAVDYDSRTTATLNASLRVHRRDGVTVVGFEDGRVQYRCAGVALPAEVAGEGVGDPAGDTMDAGSSADARSSPRATRAEEDTSLGVYCFELFKGNMQVCCKTQTHARRTHTYTRMFITPTCIAAAPCGAHRCRCSTLRLQLVDPSRNVYSGPVGSRAPCSVSLAGAMALDGRAGILPRVADPIPPRLFVLHGGSTAVELLSPRRWASLDASCSPLNVAAAYTRAALTSPSAADATTGFNGRVPLGFGVSSQPLPFTTRGFALPPVPVPVHDDAKFVAWVAGGSVGEPPAPQSVIHTRGYRVVSSRVSGVAAAAGGVGLVDTCGRAEVWGNCRGWIHTGRPSPGAGARVSAPPSVVGDVMSESAASLKTAQSNGAAGLGSSRTAAALAGKTSRSGGAVMPPLGTTSGTAAAAAAETSSGAAAPVVGVWPVCRVPEIVSGSPAAFHPPALVATVTRTVVEKTPVDAELRSELERAKKQYGEWLQVRHAVGVVASVRSSCRTPCVDTAAGCVRVCVRACGTRVVAETGRRGYSLQRGRPAAAGRRRRR